MCTCITAQATSHLCSVFKWNKFRRTNERYRPGKQKNIWDQLNANVLHTGLLFFVVFIRPNDDIPSFLVLHLFSRMLAKSPAKANSLTTIFIISNPNPNSNLSHNPYLGLEWGLALKNGELMNFVFAGLCPQLVNGTIWSITLQFFMWPVIKTLRLIIHVAPNFFNCD